MTVISLSALQADNPFSLWYQAREIAEANINQIPGVTHQLMATVDDRSGKVIQSSDIRISHSMNDNSEIVSTLLSKETDGEEADHPDNDRMVAGMLEKDLTPKREGLFFTEIGEKLKVKPTRNRKEINGFNCLEFEIEFTNTGQDGKDVTFLGSVWLDEKSGAPIYNTFVMDKTPRFVRDISIERYYHYDPEQRIWFLSEMVSKAEIRFLLKRMTNTTRITYSDYWLYEPKESN